MSDAGIESRLVIWGTDVVVSEAKDKFKKFINDFIDEDADELADGFDPLLPLYIQRLDEVLQIVSFDLIFVVLYVLINGWAWLVQLVRSLPSNHKVPGSILGPAKN